MGAWLEAELSKTQEHREGLEPSSPHYESGVFAARSPVLVLQVGPEGLEPSPARLRAGDAAANTSVPSIESARWESNPGHRREAVVVRLIRTPLSPLSYAPAVRVGPEGIEPTPAGLKVRCAACYTTTLCLAGCIRFNRRACNIVQLLVVPCSSGSPES
jgi:hypothetical protein